MKHLAFVFLMGGWFGACFHASPALAALVWDGVSFASLTGTASASTLYLRDPYEYYSDSMSESLMFPEDNLPLVVAVSASTPRAYATGTGEVTGNDITLSLLAAEIEGTGVQSSGHARLTGVLRRSFFLQGGTGATPVSIPFDLTGSIHPGSRVRAGWYAGVLGEGLLSGMHSWGTIAESYTWTGTLNYGQLYEFEWGLYAHGWSEESYAAVEDYRISTPIPEPSTLVLLAAGLGTALAGARMRRKQGRRA